MIFLLLLLWGKYPPFSTGKRNCLMVAFSILSNSYSKRRSYSA
jgi:hypothetical protein